MTQKTKCVLIVLAAVLVAVAGATAAVLVVFPPRSAPTGSAEWGFLDLRDHLHSKGVTFTVQQCEYGSESRYFVDPKWAEAHYFILDLYNPNPKDGYSWKGCLLVKDMGPSEAAAYVKELHRQRDAGFAWGRFAFQGDPPTVERVRKALD